MAFALRFPVISSKLGKGANFNAAAIRHLSVTLSQYGKIVPFKLSDIGEGIREVTIKEWFVKPGDRVSQFDNICEVESDKASVTITSRFDGQVRNLRYKVEEVALVGKPLVDIELIGDEEERQNHEIAENANRGNPESLRSVGEPPEALERVNEAEITVGWKVLATPAVRRIAAERKVDLSRVKPTGRGGRVLKEDVLVYLGEIPGQEGKGEGEGGGGGKIKETRVQLGDEKGHRGTFHPLKGHSRHMWRTMTEALEIPHFVYSDDCDVSRLVSFRNEVKGEFQKQGVALTFMPFFIKAASQALEKMPHLNSWVEVSSETGTVFGIGSGTGVGSGTVIGSGISTGTGISGNGTETGVLPGRGIATGAGVCTGTEAGSGCVTNTGVGFGTGTGAGSGIPGIRVFPQHNIAFAMDTPNGLVVPNIKNVQDLRILEIARELNRLLELGRRSALTPADITGGTFTLSNIGNIGGTYMKPVILPPQIVIGGIGKIQKLPMYNEKGEIVPRDILNISWAADHRVVDGGSMAKFSNLWKGYIENPAHLLVGL